MMVKSLLLGIGAVFIAIAVTQAADFLVRPKTAVVRKDLRFIRCTLLLHPGQRYVPEDGWMGQI